MDIIGKLKQQPKKSGRRVVPRQPKQSTETVESSAPPTTAAGEKQPPSLSKRQQRSARRLQEYQEKKRLAAEQDYVASGMDPVVAKSNVARDERRRLERIAAQHTAPMEMDSSSVDGHPPGDEGPQHSDATHPKRVRVSPPEDGRSASRHDAVPQGSRDS